MMRMSKIIKHKNAYIKSFKDAIVGNELKVSYPNVDSTSPYYTELNEEQEVSTFAYNVGKVVKDNVSIGSGGGSSNGGNGGGSVGDYDNRYALKDHNHDDIYAKRVHNHDDRYYTKTQTDEWRDRLINGDLLFGKINSNHIQAGTIIAGSTIIADGAIGNVHISKVSADKLDAGVIDTSRVTISGTNGNLKLRGNRLQVFQGIGSNQYERVSLGDVNNDGTVYGLRVRGADGNTILYDENGVYREGITDGSINNDKIGDDANIDGGKLNINSVIDNINKDGTGTIHGTKIDIDGESVSSKVFKIELNQSEHSETIERQQSEIDQNKEQIKLKVSNQKYTEDMASMTSKLEKAESDIEILNEGIKLTASKTEVQNQINNLKDFVSEELGDISVGGTNYLNNSAPRKAVVDELVTWDRTLNGTRRLTYWQDYNDSVELPQIGYHPHIDLETFHFPCIALINRNAKFNMANRELSLRQEINNEEDIIIPNEQYVISFDAYSDTSLFSFHGGLYHKNVESNNYNYHSGRMDITIEEEHVGTWKRYSYSFTTHKGIDTSEPIYFVVNGHNNPEGSGYIKNIKLEKGHIVSQWTPSQTDIDDSLDDVVNDMKEYTNESIKNQNAQLKVEFDNITSRVDATEKDVNGVRGSVSEISQRADSISSTVTDLSGKYTELKQTVDGIDITGKVSFYDLRTAGATVINGSNITTGTINTNRVNIKGGTTKKIVIANDNYCVYDGSETDVNRKVFMGFRTNTATNVPSVMLGYNGINPSVDGAVVSGGTYTTYSHYPNNDNPESVNLSYGALAFKYGANYNQFSTLNMYQNGDIDLKAGASIYFRPNLRAKDNHVFGISDTSVGSRVPFQCTSTIYANGDITTDKGLYGTYLSIQGNAGVSNKFSAVNVVTNRIDVYGNSNLDGTVYMSGACTIGSELNVKNKAIYGMGNIALARGTIYLPQGGGNNTTDYLRIGGGFVAGVSSGNFHFLTSNGNSSNLYASNVRSAYSLEPNSRLSDISALDQIDSVSVVNTSEGLRLIAPTTRMCGDESSVVTTTYNEETNQEEINVDYNSAISTLWKAIQELRQENEELKKLIKGE